MAVFTPVDEAAARALLARMALGELVALRGIAGGIENTNYFLTTTRGEWVLTLFERLEAAQLPFYLGLMQHLARRGIPVPEPQPVLDGGDILLHLCGKPACIVNRLRGQNQLQPAPVHCAALGRALARMHLAGRDFARQQPNPRGLAWWQETVPLVLPHISAAQAALLRAELAFQIETATRPEYAALPRGPIHADLFRDNVMFDGDLLCGLFDFYFAGVDCWLFDLAVCLNDWCVDLISGAHDGARAAALLAAYQRERPLTQAERSLFNPLLRAAALRFWLSRLWDFYLPRPAALLTPHDPAHFERIVRQRIACPPDADMI